LSLSVCCLTNAPGPRVRAIFEPLREVADEIVIAADASVDEADLAEYRAVADKVPRREVGFFEPNLAWLHEQCSCDWIFRLDGDEVPSVALVEALPRLTAEPEIRQYWFPFRWVDASGGGWFDEIPWAPDYHNRLVRNDETLRFEGASHTGAARVFLSRYVEEPIYHLICALTTTQERLLHSFLSYEVREPNRIAPGGGPFNTTYYLPERSARRAPVAVPEPDRERIASALGRQLEVPRGFPRERPAGESVRLVESDLRMYPGEVRAIFVQVTNRSDERWPGGLEDEPRVRLSYHLRRPDGENVAFEGERSPITEPVDPGARAIVPVTVVAPNDVGGYEIELDLVHEDVRWLGQGVAAPLDVVPQGTLSHNVPGRLRRLRGRRIPERLHQIWLGPAQMPEEHARFAEGWREHHPDWEYRLWTEHHLDELGITPEHVERGKNASEVSNLMRYRILERHGGVYVDTDFESLRPLGPLLHGVEAFAAYTLPGIAATGIMGCVQGHPAFRLAADLSLITVGTAPPPIPTGPQFFTHVLADFPDVTIFPRELFFPYLWDEPHRRHERFEHAYAVHHWALSWLEPAEA
jgi:inositol phosphorylceramide mannosyltransferase catalytic subunit